MWFPRTTYMATGREIVRFLLCNHMVESPYSGKKRHIFFHLCYDGRKKHAADSWNVQNVAWLLLRPIHTAAFDYATFRYNCEPPGHSRFICHMPSRFLNQLSCFIHIRHRCHINSQLHLNATPHNYSRRLPCECAFLIRKLQWFPKQKTEGVILSNGNITGNAFSDKLGRCHKMQWSCTKHI